MSASPWIVDVSKQDFEQVVLLNSKERPVLIDFWAPWCGPCKTLGPILEKLAEEGDGRFLLAKIDTDQNPELASMFQVQGIPMVLCFDKGGVVDGFTGIKSEAEVRDFLDKVAPVQGNPILERSAELVAAGDRAAAIALLQEFVASDPDHKQARIQLATLLLDDGRSDDAEAAIAELANDDDPELERVRTALKLKREAGDVEELRRQANAAPNDLALRIKLGQALIANSDYEGGLGELLHVVVIDREFDSQAARKLMLQAFELLGEEHELVEDFRHRLQMVLF